RRLDRSSEVSPRSPQIREASPELRELAARRDGKDPLVALHRLERSATTLREAIRDDPLRQALARGGRPRGRPVYGASWQNGGPLKGRVRFTLRSSSG